MFSYCFSYQQQHWVIIYFLKVIYTFLKVIYTLFIKRHHAHFQQHKQVIFYKTMNQGPSLTYSGSGSGWKLILLLETNTFLHQNYQLYHTYLPSTFTCQPFQSVSTHLCDTIINIFLSRRKPNWDLLCPCFLPFVFLFFVSPTITVRLLVRPYSINIISTLFYQP